MKKVCLNSLALVALLTSCLVGCTEKSDKIQIKIGMWPQSQLTNEVNMFKEWKRRFESEYSQYEIVPSNYEYARDTVQVKAQGHNLPTIFQAWFTEPSFLVEKGYVKDITAQLTELNWLDKMDDFMRTQLTFDEKIYGVPRDGYGLGLLLNTKTLGEAGLLPDSDGDGHYEIYSASGEPLYPQTFDEIKQMSIAISESIADTAGILILSSNKNGGWQFSNMAWNFGATLEKQDENGKWIATLNDPKAVEALEWIRDMKREELLIRNTTVNYSDWASDISEKVAMAFVGSDVVKLAVTTGGMNKDDIAFVPMPAGPHGDRYSLYGGTPFVISSDASDEEAMGALRFLEFMGRSPETSENSLKAMEEGFEVSEKKGEPIIETIKPWKNSEYLTEQQKFEDRYVNVDNDNYKDFFDSIDEIKHSEVPYYAQEMYTTLDTVIQAVLSNPDTADCANLLESANSTFNNNYMSKLNK